MVCVHRNTWVNWGLFEGCYFGSQYKIRFGKDSGREQQIMAQEVLANLDLEIPCFCRSLFSSVVIHSQNKTQSP